MKMSQVQTTSVLAETLTSPITRDTDSTVDGTTQMKFDSRSYVILFETLLIVSTNIITLLILFKTSALRTMNRFYLCSLTLADLAIGILVTPFSFLTSLFPSWIYGETFCQIEAYLAAILWIASLYSFVLVSTDNYMAVKKPLKYECQKGQRTRFVCWIVLTWVTACSICAPPLFGQFRAKYYPAAKLCIIDWKSQMAYFITCGILVAVPPAFALAFTNLYICSKSYKEKRELFESGLIDELRNIPNNYVVNIVVAVVFLFSWVPWCISQVYIIVNVTVAKLAVWEDLEFYLMWLAVGNSCWKFFVYTSFSTSYRRGLRLLFCYKRNLFRRPQSRATQV